MATAIVGIGVAALLGCIASGTQANDGGQKLTTAAFLAQEIREWTLRLPFKDPDPGQGATPGPDGSDPQTFVDDIDDLYPTITYSPPHDGRGNNIPNMPGWSQKITLTYRSPANLSTVVTAGTSDMIYVNVEVLCNSQSILTTGWLVSKR